MAIIGPHIRNFDIDGKKYNITIEHNGGPANGLDPTKIAQIESIAKLIIADIKAKNSGSLGDRVIQRIDSSGVHFTSGADISLDSPLENETSALITTLSAETQTYIGDTTSITTKSLLEAIGRIITGSAIHPSSLAGTTLAFTPADVTVDVDGYFSSPDSPEDRSDRGEEEDGSMARIDSSCYSPTRRSEGEVVVVVVDTPADPASEEGRWPTDFIGRDAVILNRIARWLNGEGTLGDGDEDYIATHQSDPDPTTLTDDEDMLHAADRKLKEEAPLFD